MRTWIQRDLALKCLALAALVTLGPATAQATVESAKLSLPSCLTLGGAGSDCTDTAFLNTNLVGATSEFIGSPSVNGATATFTTAFDAWDEASGGAWKLVNGGTISVSTSAYTGINASVDGAGLSPVLFTVSGSQTILKNLVWTQALVINYSPLTGPLAKPEETLDTFSLSQNAAGANPNFSKACAPASSGASPSGGAFCGPIYPFQYGSTLADYSLDGRQLGGDPFYDAPEGDWPNAGFDAITLLSSVNEQTDTLTVYQGWSYGFTLSAEEPTANISGSKSLVLTGIVPETSTWVMMVLGFAGLGCAVYRKTRGGQASTVVA